jgi:hypothetical protein
MAKLAEQCLFHDVPEYLVAHAGEHARVQLREFGRAFGAQLGVAAFGSFKQRARCVGDEELVVHSTSVPCASASSTAPAPSTSFSCSCAVGLAIELP